MNIHKELTLPYRKLRMRLERKIILIKSVTFCADDLHRTLAVKAVLNCSYRLDCRRSASITGSVIMIYGIVYVLCCESLKVAAAAEVLVPPLCRVVMSVRNEHDACSVNAFPETDLERYLAVAVERLVTPHKLLGRESDDAGVSSHSREGPSETEAVRKEDIGTLNTEFVTIEMLSVKDVTGK
jgi:hypothetical protein